MTQEIKNRVEAHRAVRAPISKDVHRELKEQATLGQRVADWLTAWMGSWSFIGLFFAACAVWMGGNMITVCRLLIGSEPFDPFPFVFLNLALSLMAAIQGSIIMLSQNRQGAKDRALAEHNYEVNLKMEQDIHHIMDAIDRIGG